MSNTLYMTKGAVLLKNGKRFKVVDLAHWSQVESEDGEKDYVKWMGDVQFVGQGGGSYTLVESP